MPGKLGIMFNVGSAVQLLTLLTMVWFTQAQHALATRPERYLDIPHYAPVIWRVYTVLSAAFGVFMLYAVYGGRSVVVICVTAVTVTGAFAFSAIGFYTHDQKSSAVLHGGMGSSFMGYCGMMMGPEWFRMTAAALMVTGAVVGVLGARWIYAPTPSDQELERVA